MRRITIGAIFGLLICSCSRVEEAKNKLMGESNSPEPVCVKVMTIESEEHGALVRYVGRVESARSAILTVPYPGTLKSVSVGKGSRIREGQVLAVIESETVKSTYEVSQATLERAKDAYDRMMLVYDKGGVTEIQFQEISAELRKAEAAYSAAKKALDNCTIRAPFDAVVDQVHLHAGMEVSALAPLMNIMSASHAEIHCSVPEKDMTALFTGQRAEIEVPAIGKTYPARLSVKGYNASPLAHTYDCTFIPIGDTAQLLPGMVCKVTIAASSNHQTIIPSGAIMTDGEGRYVWCVEDGIVRKVRIYVQGYASGGIAVEGLPEGTSLVTEGRRKISSGMLVKTIEE